MLTGILALAAILGTILGLMALTHAAKHSASSGDDPKAILAITDQITAQAKLISALTAIMIIAVITLDATPWLYGLLVILVVMLTIHVVAQIIGLNLYCDAYEAAQPKPSRQIAQRGG